MKDSSGTFRTLEPRLRSEFTSAELASTGSPTAYYTVGQAVFPVAIPDYSSTLGVELAFQRGGNHFESSDTDDEPGFNPQFHQYLSVGAALRYAVANGMSKKVTQLEKMKKMIKDAVVEHYERRSPDDRTRMRLKKDVRKYGLGRGGSVWRR